MALSGGTVLLYFGELDRDLGAFHAMYPLPHHASRPPDTQACLEGAEDRRLQVRKELHSNCQIIFQWQSCWSKVCPGKLAYKVYLSEWSEEKDNGASTLLEFYLTKFRKGTSLSSLFSATLFTAKNPRVQVRETTMPCKSLLQTVLRGVLICKTASHIF